MTETLSTPQILGLLDRMAKLYPAGIPKNAIKKAPPATIMVSNKKLVLIAQSEKPLKDDERSLAEAICTKGLKLPYEQCEILSLGADKLSIEVLNELSAKFLCRAILILGADKPVGTVETFNTTLTLWSYSLSEIASEPAKKREFWEQLKRVISALS
jgi:hypothetical protein